MDGIFWTMFVGFCIIYFVAAYFYDKTRDQKKKIDYYKKAYDEAKDAWAAQSNAVREKGIECDQLKKENKKLEKDYDDVCEQLIIEYGLQECWSLAQILLSYGMIGDEKKKALATIEERGLLMEALLPLAAMISRNRRLLWVWIVLHFGVCAFISFSVFTLLTWLK